LLCFLLLLGLIFWYRGDAERRIERNQDKALTHMVEVYGALTKWCERDYDGNGRKDYPLFHLEALVNSEFINGELFELIPSELSRADLREEASEPCDGYYFTLTDLSKPWPAEGMVDHLAILARPAVMGETGSCWFYMNTQKELFYSNYPLEGDVPPWPSLKHIQAEIWTQIPPDIVTEKIESLL
jgi:hypothetical protein